MPSVLTLDIPEQGQLVEVRQQRYIVTSVLPGTLPHSIYPKWLERAQHLFLLPSVEDEALGEELEVIWVLEAGERVVADANLPTMTSFDVPQRLITSVDFLKREWPTLLFGETLPAAGEPLYLLRFDQLIVDEAHHNVAPADQVSYAGDSLRTAPIRMLVPHFEHCLFLTATSHNWYKECATPSVKQPAAK